MNKFFNLVVASAASLLILAGCGSNAAAPETTVTPDNNTSVEAPANPPADSNMENGSELDMILDRGHILVGTMGDRPPFSYVASDGSYQGLDPFIARRLALELFGDENAVEFVETTAANRIPFLTSNRVDLILASFTVTEERAESVAFAEPYMTVYLGLLGPEGTTVSSLEDLKNGTVIVTTGSSSEIFFTMEHPEINILSFGQTTEAFAAMADGRGDAIAMDNSILFLPNEGLDVILPYIGGDSTIAPAVNLNSHALLDWVNDTMVNLRAEGFFEVAFTETLEPAFIDGVTAEDIMILN